MNRFVTRQVYDDTEECNCGGPIFKFHNTSRNVFVAKCGYFKKIIEIDKETKRKIWIAPKKVACDWRITYNAERPVFKEINKILIKRVADNKKNVNEQLEERLKVLFRFLYVSNHASTLDEIDILVKNNLLREPRKTFYYPTTSYFMRISHRETFEEYERRIFSKKIIDLSASVTEIVTDKSFTFHDLPFLRSSVKTQQTVVIKRPKVIASQFVEVTDEDSDQETNVSESELSETEESETEEIERGQSDFESVFDEPEEIEETEEYDDNDYYDDD